MLRVRALSLISMLTQATAQTAQTQLAAQPVANGAGADRSLPTGTIINIQSIPDPNLFYSSKDAKPPK